PTRRGLAQVVARGSASRSSPRSRMRTEVGPKCRPRPVPVRPSASGFRSTRRSRPSSTRRTAPTPRLLPRLQRLRTKRNPCRSPTSARPEARLVALELDDQLAEVVAGEEADECFGRAVDAFELVHACLDLPFGEPTRELPRRLLVVVPVVEGVEALHARPLAH